MLREFVYLFLIDLVRTPVHDYKSYLKREPGYGSGMLNAYITAFSQETKGLMTKELIHSIHKEAMGFSLQASPGQYKNNHNRMDIYPYQMDKYLANRTYSVTPEGVHEFIEYWFKNTKNPFHSVAVGKKDGSLANNYYFKPQYTGALLYSSDSRANRIPPKAISYEQTEKMVNILLSQSQFQCEINHFAEEDEKNIQKLTDERMQHIIENFNTDIVKAQKSDEKIKIIATHIQRINQLHPYADGNVRTCYILMNKLLKDHGLSLTLLMNPNRLDACSVDQIVEMIKQGQIHYEQVIQHKEGSITLSAEKEIPEVKSFTCIPQELNDIPISLVDNFITGVIKGNLKPSYGIKNNSHLFLSAGKKEPTEELLDKLSQCIDFNSPAHNSLIKAFKDKQYNLALRKICAGYNINVINTVLEYQAHLSFNPLEQSSNGKSAIAWLETNKHLKPNEKKSINESLSLIVPSSLEPRN